MMVTDPDTASEKAIEELGYEVDTIHDRGVVADIKEDVDTGNDKYTTVVGQSNLDPWSKETLQLYACCFVAFLCVWAGGYDGSLMTTINAMPYYQARFGVGTLGSTTGLIFAIYTVGGAVGSWFSGPATDMAGRRGGMCIGAIIICVGTAVMASAMGTGQFMAGRFILGFGFSILGTASGPYCIEISPPQWRGRIAGFYGCGWFGGAILAAAITLKTSEINSDLSWRLPVVLQAVVPFIVLCAVYLMPESPRWLIANSRDEEARTFLVRYHGGGDPASPLVLLEWNEFKEDIAIDGTDKRWWDYSGLISTRSARWRSFMVLLMAIFGQFTATGLGYYNTEIFKAVGYDDYMQFVLNLVATLVWAFAAVCGTAVSDHIPRRKILVTSTFLCAVTLAIYGGLSAQWAQAPDDAKNLHVGRGAIAAYVWFGIVNSFAYCPLLAVYPLECLQTNNRAKGMSMYVFVVNCTTFIVVYTTPIGLQNLAYKMIFIFVGWDLIETILWYFCCVETIGYTLEELEEVFSSEDPVASSKSKGKRIIKRGEGATNVC
ncbi:Sugar (and other) transporter [Ceratobasidium sp. AG-Ba]|nr:Sugar (and other) transporter [Ceratobasidium sp. AG-Ba]